MCRYGTTIRWPGLYGNRFSTAYTASPRATISPSSSDSVGMRQNGQTGSSRLGDPGVGALGPVAARTAGDVGHPVRRPQPGQVIRDADAVLLAPARVVASVASGVGRRGATRPAERRTANFSAVGEAFSRRVIQPSMASIA